MCYVYEIFGIDLTDYQNWKKQNIIYVLMEVIKNEHLIKLINKVTMKSFEEDVMDRNESC